MADEEEKAGASNIANISGAKTEETIDFSSHDFDPLKAIYSQEFTVASEDVQTYESVQQFLDTHLTVARKKKSSATATAQAATGKTEKTSRLETEPVDSNGTANDNKRAEHDAEDRDVDSTVTKSTERNDDVVEMDVKEAAPARAAKLARRNVITQMYTSFSKGPMSVLKRSVTEKLKVRVWTRSVRNIRSIMTGYVVAFDKHMNLAMIDVDELYRKPPGKHQKASKKKTSKAIEKPPETVEKTPDSEEDAALYPLTPWQTAELTVPVYAAPHLQTVPSGHTPHSPVLPNFGMGSFHQVQPSDYNTANASQIFPGADVDVVGQISSAFKGMHVFEDSEAQRLLGVKTRKLLSRHLNQVMLRGDHVVAVALVDEPT